MQLKSLHFGRFGTFTLGIIGFLMFASILFQPKTTEGQGQQFSGKEEDIPFSTARIFSKVIEKTGLNPSTDWTRTFGKTDDKDVGKDLYLTIYERTQNAPQKNAFKNVASKYGMTQGDLVLISQNDFTPLIQKKSTLTQNELLRKVQEIKVQIDEERDFQQLEADIRASVEPSEIFANGDLDDSGFDLIHDLQMIEYLLFLKSSPNDIGGAYDPANDNSSNSQSGNGAAGIGGNPGVGVSGSISIGAGNASFGKNISLNDLKNGSGQTQKKVLRSGNTGNSTATGTAQNGLNGDSAAVVGAVTGVNPATCVAGGSFDKAFSNFEEQKKINPALKDNSGNAQNNNIPLKNIPGNNGAPAGQSSQENGNQPGSQSTSENTGTSAQALSSTSEDFLPKKEETIISGNPAKPDEWLLDKPCDDVFCLDVKLSKKPATSAFQDEDNCIACHVEKLNDVLKDVVNHTLVPSKAPGNLGESAKCKKAMSTAFGSVSMNFYAVAMPVQTPKNDDLIYGTNVEDSWERFCEVTAFFPFAECKKPANSAAESEYQIPPSITNTIAQKEMANASDDTTLEEVNRNINVALQGYIANRDQDIAALQLENQSGEKATLYNSLKAELSQMNYYFFLMRDILHSLHEKIDNMPGMQACTEINNKKECT